MEGGGGPGRRVTLRCGKDRRNSFAGLVGFPRRVAGREDEAVREATGKPTMPGSVRQSTALAATKRAARACAGAERLKSRGVRTWGLGVMAGYLIEVCAHLGVIPAQAGIHPAASGRLCVVMGASSPRRRGSIRRHPGDYASWWVRHPRAGGDPFPDFQGSSVQGVDSRLRGNDVRCEFEVVFDSRMSRRGDKMRSMKETPPGSRGRGRITARGSCCRPGGRRLGPGA